MERVQMMAKIERLEMTIKTTSNNDIKLQQTIANLQNELNDKMQEERNYQSQKFTHENQIEILNKDLKFERQRMDDLGKTLNEERGEI